MAMKKAWYAFIGVVIVLGAIAAFSRSTAPEEGPVLGMPVPGGENVPEMIVTPENGAPAESSPTAEPAASPLSATAVSVPISNFAFAPVEIRIAPGTTVTWTNQDNARHNAASDGNFTGPLLAKGESWSYTFTARGTYDYYCTPHPFMKGKIIVE